MTKHKSRREITPHEDHGFFGPDSITHKVWGHPTTPLMGIVRAVTIEELDPNLLAAVHNTGANYDRLDTRYARTVQYFAAVAFADSRSVSKMADVLVKIHSKAIGIEPVSGNRYDANDPASQLWILVTGWHSVLTAYERFGPGKLSEAEVNQFWAECAIAAEFQTCDPADVPRTREEVRAYFEGWRPRLAASEATQRMMHHLLNGANEVVPRGGLLGLTRPFANWLIRTGTIATLPHHMRQLAGINQSRVTDFAVTRLLKFMMAVLHRSRPLQRWMLGILAPKTLPIVEPWWQGIAPLNAEVLTPAEARERYGYVKPAEAHLDLRARQYARVFVDQQPPSDEGLIESQPMLGALG
ncbi:oxygenase MpaB family protein [Nocardioides sp. WS12]|uniref:oxygenase MpaB family protein n=1 Tax=Nocardioides sp. WS12 TaxID=2486272 RepID=UPI0015F9DAFC|nr:oxygenase MpaB family protein [Nocardioides sp. WS12]